MTTIALNYSQSLLNAIWSGVKKTLQGIMIGYMVSRQTSANEHVAQLLINSGEYRQSDYYMLLADLNRKTIDAIYKQYND